MTIEQELQLSYYRQVAEIQKEHGVFLVQDIRSGALYVKKQLTVYNREIYQYLLEHPIENVPRLVLVIEDAGILTIVEEYIAGATLEELSANNGLFSQDRAAELAIQLCDILESFHSCSPAIVNRDIKPANLKLTPDGVLKLVDLNTAKRSDPASTEDTVLLGTQGYAAPEQYGFGSSGVQTDIYAVGVLMNELVTGKLPKEQLADGPLGRIIAKCVELDPKERYQSAAALRQALLLRNNPQAARVFGIPGFRSKNPLLWIFSALGYGMLLLIGVDLQLEYAGPVWLWIYRLGFIATVLFIVLLNGNYCKIRWLSSLAQHQNPALRWAVLLMADLALMALWVILFDMVPAAILL